MYFNNLYNEILLCVKMEASMNKDIINKLHIANAVEFMKTYMEENSIDLTITSPPYDNLRNYKGYKFKFEEMANELFRITKKGGIVVWVIGDKIKNGNKSLTSFKHGLYFQEIGFNVHDVMIYAKKKHSLCAVKCLYQRV